MLAGPVKDAVAWLVLFNALSLQFVEEEQLL